MILSNKAASRIATGLLYAAVASVPVGILTAPAAHAETPTVTAQAAPAATASSTPRWSKHDKKVMKAANKTCRKITDDVTWEFCVVGAFHLGDADSKTRRVLTVDDYKINNKGQIVLVNR